ncbi:Uncharacterised protein [Mycobacteroides abscessus subsp. bolletii]|uniref:DUF7213 family protein n=1 Tax=Mycobacteroides abscessus TaxID=36809 RepID=UPI00092AAFCB|nr:hypothetical protein [Mycobacteroides abscessus]QSM04895.1 hypothetical protein PROPHIGD91-4_44 [Mycobacterium phage prophi91-4]QSM87823.1 hypothetical protein I3U44_18675 [Mycobacteroides abscessus subsp. bolletii]SIB01404.1 Uncharacterised protein [Mycobacteroides abscessus subsp. bolletii]SII69665.1 Uncharacterised protein [Mycobacteroides abscessus subsp. bolletii]SKS56941.1 Uncharacterised protein [Mycobacteroides abscessus subsp. bolletii]
MDTELKAAFNRLEDVVNEIHRLCADSDEPTSIPTDYVLVVGAQLIDDDGDRVGGVSYFPKGGSQPPYITAGLLEVARAMLARQAADD